MSNSSGDWSCHSPSFLVGWGLPVAALALSASLAPGWMPVIWPIAFLWMSAACLVNVARCGRVHCYFTGTLFLILAILSGLHGFKWIDLGGNAWSVMGMTALIGGCVLTVVPEMIMGRYRNSKSPNTR